MFLPLLVILMLMRLLLFLGHEQVHRNNAAEPERPPDDTASVANLLCCFSHRSNVSTVFLIPPQTSLSNSFALYRATAAGLREPPWSPAIRAAEVGRKG